MGRCDTTPVPLWNLINSKYYSSMNIQYSRGCPYDCEFCDITVLFGHVPRTKTKKQRLFRIRSVGPFSGWRSDVFVVDDNFIGNKTLLKKEILPAIIHWMEQRKHPFALNTEASINLSDDEELMNMMVKAGFNTVFVGIESPNEESLIECKKSPNRNRNLVESVKKLQHNGLQVTGRIHRRIRQRSEFNLSEVSRFYSRERHCDCNGRIAERTRRFKTL